jgi:DNA-binding NarL/FixJ family response regulator
VGHGDSWAATVTVSATASITSAVLPSQLSCLVADSEGIVRTGLRLIVDSQPDLEVTAEAGDGEEAIEMAGRERPDVVLMDVRMPGLDGIEATRRIVSTAEEACERVPSVIILTGAADEAGDESTALACLRAGALGFLLRTSGADALVAAIRAVYVGHVVLDPGVAHRFAGRWAVKELSPSKPTRLNGSPLGRALQSLSPREREVLAGLASGRSNRQLALDFGVREATVKTHVSRLLTKLGLHSRTEAVALAYQTGVIPGLSGLR